MLDKLDSFIHFLSGRSFSSVLFLFLPVSSGVFIIPGLQEEERVAVQKRSHQVLRALHGLCIQAEQAPVIAVLCSGGGLRAHIACLGVLSELRRHGLLDVVTYLAGVSGSTWAMSSFYAKDGNLEDIEAELKRRFDQREWDRHSSLQEAVWSAKTLKNYSLTDFWAYLVVSKQTRELQGSHLSSMKTLVDEGTMPYPIFAAIDNDLHSAWQKEKNQKTWFEFTPHHAGYPALRAYVAATHFGSQFKGGRMVRQEPERDLTFLRDQLSSLREKFSLMYHPMEDECHHSWMTEVIQRWTEISLEEQEQFLEYLAYCFQRQEQDPMRTVQTSVTVACWDYFVFLLKTAICCSKWEWGTTYNFLHEHGGVRDRAMHTRELLHLVDAGFAINTPYPLVLPPIRQVDLILSFDFSAGDPFQTIRATAKYCQHHGIPFPPVEEAALQEWSRAPRSCHILRGAAGPVVMHFPLFNTDNCGDDIPSWRDRYGTFQGADSYSRDMVTQLLEVSKKNVGMNKTKILSEVKNVASSLPLAPGSALGTETCSSPRDPEKLCSGEVEELTISSPGGLYQEVKFKFSEDPKLPAGDEEECSLEDTVVDVRGSRTVGIQITNRTGVTFKDPMLCCRSGQAHVRPPPVLPPNSTVHCSFTKTASSFQGTAGLLAYQGPDEHLALLFSVPFSYTLHCIQFALAVLRGPLVQDDLEQVFDGIMEKEAPDPKVVKCILQTPQGALELKDGSLSIRATVSNVHVAKMDVVVETKAT
ncbi:cytosolic phospholipase A2 gamma [Marmota monax]|uniref:Cytosolic phospholipase A2 gamma n=1 Tax=Marmota monax TaxID=9995 RepID=A0A834QN36_MARMO|nr:cytosolic phospholipase A2 gamma [Marmota monax]